MIKTALLSVVLGATPSPPPLPPLPPMWPGPVTSPQPEGNVHLDWADPIGRLYEGELIYHPPLLEPWYPSVPDTRIDVAKRPGPDPRTAHMRTHAANAKELSDTLPIVSQVPLE